MSRPYFRCIAYDTGGLLTKRQDESLALTFADPPREFGAMPFWFWNDDLDEREIVRQIHEFHAKGFGGFIPHARIGLSRRVGYLTDEYFRLIRIAAKEAHRLSMKVVLYDEGSYPSGSAQGRVVAENPEYAARCLIALHRVVEGPATGYWRPNPGRAMQDRLVCVVVAREVASGALDLATLSLCEPSEAGLVRYDVPEGTWRLVACWNVYTGGTIRGVFDEEDDDHALAPAASDLMNPDAVACFLRHTHEQYYKHLREYFGTTVVAMFTDEPNPIGRSARRGPHPWPFTDGFLEEVQERWDSDVRLWLPALWIECGPRTGGFRKTYARAYRDRVEQVFYAAQGQWCAQHGIALTGHPEKSNEMGALHHFHWPGQDMVWRYVVPDSPTALEGPHSIAPKAASSAALIGGRRCSTTEVLGAYGWRLTLDEAKWLLDWHLVRGNNLFFLHACFYSVRGRRAFESEPDISIHNVWWPYFRLISDYLRRVCWVLTDGAEVCDVAILTDRNDMAWSAAKELFRAQIDFVYVDDASLGKARVEDGRLVVGSQRFRALVCDPPCVPDGTLRVLLGEFRAVGGVVLEEWKAERLIGELTAALGRDVDWPDAPDLRAIHYRKEGRDFYFLVNEGEETLEGELSLASVGSVALWDPLDGSTRPWPACARDGRTRTSLRLERRQGLILAIDPTGTLDPNAELPRVPGEAIAEVSGPWRAETTSGEPVEVPCPGDWAATGAAPDRTWETFSGSLRFRSEFRIPRGHAERALFLDLGRVADIAEVFVNGQSVGVRAWRPYVFDITGKCRDGANALEVRVTNSLANRYDGLQMPSGLMGPVVVRAARSCVQNP